MAGHPAVTEGRTAVITGAASGIGLAAAKRLAGLGLNVCLADRPGDALTKAEQEVRDIGRAEVLSVATDVSLFPEVEALRDAALARFGDVALLMNNAAIDPVGGPWTGLDNWRRLLDVNLWGVLHGVQAFAPVMIGAGKPGAIINTGSKQGITTPPGNTAYNVSKAGVKALTEATAHELREIPGCQVTGHLLIPGFTYTGLTKAAEKPAGAWTAEQVIDFMLEKMSAGDFYILCPDNDVTRAVDEKRMAWAMGDIIENRPALSRWHKEYREHFATYMAD